MRTQKHYEALLAQNPNASIGFSLAAQAIYAAQIGFFDPNINFDGEKYRRIAVRLKRKYGENLNVDEVLLEMRRKTMRPKSRITEMQARNKTICEYCGKTKEGLSFVIGASRTPDWMMVEGTGAMCCPECWERARLDGQAAVEKSVKGG